MIEDGPITLMHLAVDYKTRNAALYVCVFDGHHVQLSMKFDSYLEALRFTSKEGILA